MKNIIDRLTRSIEFIFDTKFAKTLEAAPFNQKIDNFRIRSFSSLLIFIGTFTPGKIWLCLITALALLNLASCGGKSDSKMAITVSKTENKPEYFDYDFGAGCPYYFYTASDAPQWDFRNSGISIEAQITDVYGKLIEQIQSKNQKSDGITVFHGKDIINRHASDFLTIRCTYSSGIEQQTFSYMHRLADQSIWKTATADETNSIYFDVSMLSDLDTKIRQNLLRSGYTYENAAAAANKAVLESFSGVTYGLIENKTLRNDFSTFELIKYRSELSPNGRAFRRLKQAAEIFTQNPSGDIERLINKTTSDYTSIVLNNTRPTSPGALGGVFSALLKEMSTNKSDFSASDWINRSSIASNITAYSYNLDHAWSAGIEPISNTNGDESYITKSQTIKIDAQGYSNIFLEFDLENLVGGCSAAIFACVTSSGMSGVYVCFKKNSDELLGCVIFSAITDAITIPNYIGNTFRGSDPLSSTKYRFIALKNYSFYSGLYGLSRSIDLESIAQLSGNWQLQTAMADRSLGALEVGAFVSFSTGNCYHCVAKIVLRKLAISRL
jgi:hypothetical protein